MLFTPVLLPAYVNEHIINYLPRRRRLGEFLSWNPIEAANYSDRMIIYINFCE